MAFRVVAMACAVAIATSLTSATAVAEVPSATSPRRPDCGTLPPASEAYRDCLGGRVPRDPSGRRGTSPDTLRVAPTPTTPAVPGTDPAAPGGVPGAPGTQQGTVPAMPGGNAAPAAPGTPALPGGVPGSGR